MPPVEKDEKKPAKPLPAPKLEEEAEDEAGDVELPADPDELRAVAKRYRRQLRAAERKLEDAGLSKKEEARLVDAMAKLEAKLVAIETRLTPEDEDETEDEDASTPAPGDTDDDECPFCIF